MVAIEEDDRLALPWNHRISIDSLFTSRYIIYTPHMNTHAHGFDQNAFVRLIRKAQFYSLERIYILR